MASFYTFPLTTPQGLGILGKQAANRLLAWLLPVMVHWEAYREI
jgi:hypothetical protein